MVTDGEADERSSPAIHWIVTTILPVAITLSSNGPHDRKVGWIDAGPYGLIRDNLKMFLDHVRHRVQSVLFLLVLVVEGQAQDRARMVERLLNDQFCFNLGQSSSSAMRRTIFRLVMVLFFR